MTKTIEKLRSTATCSLCQDRGYRTWCIEVKNETGKVDRYATRGWFQRAVWVPGLISNCFVRLDFRKAGISACGFEKVVEGLQQKAKEKKVPVPRDI